MHAKRRRERSKNELDGAVFINDSNGKEIIGKDVGYEEGTEEVTFH